MVFREVSVNEIREVLRVWLGVAGLSALTRPVTFGHRLDYC